MRKLSLKHLRKPTPRKWRRFGNALCAAGLAISSVAFANDNAPLGWATVALFGTGKFITELVKEDDKKEA